MEYKRYFQSYYDYFWDRNGYSGETDDGFVVYEFSGSSETIGYSNYIMELLDTLAEESIPPLGSLLLVFIATNPESETGIAKIETFLTQKLGELQLERHDFFRAGTVIDFLKLLQALPQEYKTKEKRFLLFQTVFRECHRRLSKDKAKKILSQFRDHFYSPDNEDKKFPFNTANFIKDFKTIAMLKNSFPTVQSLIKAMENLPQEEMKERLSEEILEDESKDTVDDFIESLLNNNVTFQTGSLIKRIWSGLNIPLHHTTPSEQPMGGISDLTNKGDFDKLLISEFANDDAVFMSRIANNEALYIQREIPPQLDDFKRILLIDTSLKNWGNPKILAFASALAIVKHPKTDIECSVFAVGNDYKQVAVNTVHQVIDGLGELSGTLDCAAGLEKFIIDHPKDVKHQEVFILSAEESLKQLSMRRIMGIHGDSINYILSTSIEGDVHIYKNQNKGLKLFQHMVLPLEELWDRKKGIPMKTTPFSMQPMLPLLHSIERNYQNIFHLDGIFYAYFNKCLYQFNPDNFEKGLEIVASGLPAINGQFAMITDARGKKKIMSHSSDSTNEVSVISLDHDSIKVAAVPMKEVNNSKRSLFSHNNIFYCKAGAEIWEIDKDLNLVADHTSLIKNAYEKYASELSRFTIHYKKSKPRYGIMKNLNDVRIFSKQLFINSYRIDYLYFKKISGSGMHFKDNERNMVFKTKVNLLLKRPGSRMIELIKDLKEQVGLSLVEAREIAEHGSGIIVSNITLEKANDIKAVLEKNGTICFTETLCAESADGSTITNDNGVLVFKSSKPEIPVFYIPFVLNAHIVMATDNEFCGNPYFIKEDSQDEIPVASFEEKYYKPFIEAVLTNGT